MTETLESKENGETVPSEDPVGVLYQLGSLDGGEDLPPPLDLSSRPQDGRPHLVFLSARELKQFVRPDTRLYMAKMGPITIGLASISGRAITLFRLGASSGGGASAHDPESTPIHCQLEGGDPLLLEGGRALRIGSFPRTEGGVSAGGAVVPELSLTVLYRWVEERAWRQTALPPRFTFPPSSDRGS